MQFTLSTAVLGAFALTQTFASAKPIVSGYNGTYVPSPTGYRWPNGTFYNGTFSNATNSTSGGSPVVTVWETIAPPPAYSVAPVPMASYTPGPKLTPAVHWDHPVDDINNLAPTSESSLYYSTNGTADPAVEHMFASLNTTSQYQSVVLAHSSYVQSVSCAEDGILVTFTNSTGFNFAANAWPDHGEDFVLVTYTDGCGQSSDQRTFWLIDSLTYRNETNAIDAKVTREIAVEDAFNEVHMVWGKYQPAENSTNTKRGFFGDLNSDSKSITKTADINLSAPTNDASPWGGAALLFEEPGKVSVSNKSGSAIDTDFKIFCVNCGVKSHFVLMGEAAWQYIPPKVTKLTAEVDANIVANFHLGMVATATFDDTKQKELFKQAIPDLGFSVGGVFTAGVYVTVDAVATLNIEAEGQALAGVTMTVPDFKATVDMTSQDSGSNSKITGFTPQWEKQFEVAGAIGAKATLALPVGLHLGITIVKVFDKSVALVEQPSLSAEAKVAASFGGAAAPGVTCNNGVSYSVDAHNDVTLNLFDIKTFNLDHRDWNILSGCQPIPGLGSTSSSTVQSTTVQSSTKIESSTVISSQAGASTGTGAPSFPGSNTTVPHGTGIHTSHPIGTGTGIPHHGANVTSGAPYGSAGVTSRPIATGTGGIPHYGGGSSNATHTKPHGSAGISTHPEATATIHSVPGYGGSNETSHTKPHGSAGISTHPEATATSHSVPSYGGHNTTAEATTKAEATSTASIPGYGSETTAEATTKTKATATASVPGYGSESSSTHAAATTSASVPSYGHESSSSASSATTKAEATSKTVPAYGASSSASSSFVTSTKPAAATTTPEVSSYGGHKTSSSTCTDETTTAAPTTTSHHTTTTTTTTSSSTSTKATTTKAATTSAAEYESETTPAAKTSKKPSFGY